MSVLIGIFDDGYTKDRKGRTVSAIRFRIITGEGEPADILLPAYKDAVIKNLRRLAFQKRACRVCGCTDDHACEGGCCWVDKDLCSTCADKDQSANP